MPRNSGFTIFNKYEIIIHIMPNWPVQNLNVKNVTSNTEFCVIYDLINNVDMVKHLLATIPSRYFHFINGKNRRKVSVASNYGFSWWISKTSGGVRVLVSKLIPSNLSMNPHKNSELLMSGVLTITNLSLR